MCSLRTLLFCLNTMPWGLIRKRRIGVVSGLSCRAYSKRLGPAAILKYLKICKKAVLIFKIKDKSLLLWADFSLYSASTQIIAKG